MDRPELELWAVGGAAGPSEILPIVRLTEFWQRMERHLGRAYASTWAQQHVLASLGERTVSEALAAGEDARAVWRAVWEALELPPSER